MLAAGVIGSFSWMVIESSYWLASALWYCCLVFSILGILLSAQQLAVLNMLPEVPRSTDSEHATNVVLMYLPLLLSRMKRPPEIGEDRGIADVGVWRPKWKMVFTWQCPMMFMSYSVCLFLAGLTLVVCTPLIRGDPWGPQSDVSEFV